MKRFWDCRKQRYENTMPCFKHLNSAIEEGAIYEMSGCGHSFSGWIFYNKTWIYCPVCGARHYIQKTDEEKMLIAGKINQRKAKK